MFYVKHHPGRGLDDEQNARLGQLLELLATDPTAPTAVTEPDAAFETHVLDSLTALDVAAPRPGDAVVDIGSGAGLPGIVLAIAMPRARFDLVESVERKCDFLRRAVEQIGLQNAAVVCERVEQWATERGREAYELALARAVAPLPTLVEYAAPLLKTDGRLVAWKGKRDPEDEAAARRAAELVGMREATVAVVEGSHNRHLHLYEKVAPTPARYPRRPGMARKRPLGSG